MQGTMGRLVAVRTGVLRPRERVSQRGRTEVLRLREPVPQGRRVRARLMRPQERAPSRGQQVLEQMQVPPPGRQVRALREHALTLLRSFRSPALYIQGLPAASILTPH